MSPTFFLARPWSVGGIRRHGPLNLAFARVEIIWRRCGYWQTIRASFGAAGQTEVLFAYKDFDYPVSRPAEILDAFKTQNPTRRMLLREDTGIYLVKFA